MFPRGRGDLCVSGLSDQRTWGDAPNPEMLGRDSPVAPPAIIRCCRWLRPIPTTSSVAGQSPRSGRSGPVQLGRPLCFGRLVSSWVRLLVQLSHLDAFWTLRRSTRRDQLKAVAQTRTGVGIADPSQAIANFFNLPFSDGATLVARAIMPPHSKARLPGS